MSKGAGSVLFYIALGGVIGGYIGLLLGLLIPAGIFCDILATGFPVGFTEPIVLNLRLLVLTFGIKLTINLFTILGMISGFYFSK